MALRVLVALAILAMLGGAAAPEAQEMRFFRIGTGGVAGTYYPIGGLIADIISSPPGARPCEQGGSCGVPGLVAIAQSSNGSVANVNGIKSGGLESGFVQPSRAVSSVIDGPLAWPWSSSWRAVGVQSAWVMR